VFWVVGNNNGPQKPTEEPHILELVQAARNGQHDAFDEIVFRYRDQVYAAAWHLTRNNEDAMDITQEAFLRAYNALGSYKGRSKFATWLHRVVLNTGIDYIRKEKRHRHESTDEINTQSDTPGTKQDMSVAATQRERVYNNELQKQVLTALEELSTRQRQVFMLRYYHDLDTKETAKVLKCTEGAVKRHLFRAQSRLRELLRDLGPGKHG
jgi:RNA polymerase sigma-70 factor, ECF subfamily